MTPPVPTTSRAPIRTAQARYVWGDYVVEVNETGAPNAATLTITRKASYPQQDERSMRLVLEVPLADGEEIVRLVRHALDHREER